MSYFPMYIELKDRPCLIAGGGSVALRKVLTLLEFGADITVIAPDLTEGIQNQKGITVIRRGFCEEDLKGAELVVAATDDAAVNRRIAELCRARKIPVNAVDQKEDCSFIFPSYVKKGEVTAAVTSGGLSPVITQYLKERIGQLMPEYIGALAEELGRIRPVVKAALPTEAQRRAVYAELLETALYGDGSFSAGEMERAVRKQIRSHKEESAKRSIDE